MRLERLCSMDLQYVGDVSMVRPYGNEAGLAFGTGVGRSRVIGSPAR